MAPGIRAWRCPGPWCPSIARSLKNEWGLREAQGLSPWGFSLVTRRDRCPLPLSHHLQGGVCPQSGVVVPLSPSKEGIRGDPTHKVKLLPWVFSEPLHLHLQTPAWPVEGRRTPPHRLCVNVRVSPPDRVQRPQGLPRTIFPCSDFGNKIPRTGWEARNPRSRCGQVGFL